MGLFDENQKYQFLGFACQFDNKCHYYYRQKNSQASSKKSRSKGDIGNYIKEGNFMCVCVCGGPTMGSDYPFKNVKRVGVQVEGK